jgi:hypothetical protein
MLQVPDARMIFLFALLRTTVPPDPAIAEAMVAPTGFGSSGRGTSAASSTRSARFRSPARIGATTSTTNGTGWSPPSAAMTRTAS